MFNLKAISILITGALIINGYAAGPDLKKVEDSFDGLCTQLKGQKDFTKRFELIKGQIKFIDSEIKKVNDQNYQQFENQLFDLNFYNANLLSLDTPFPQTDCEFQQEKLRTNFSDYKTGIIHEKLKTKAERIIKIGKCLCEK